MRCERRLQILLRSKGTSFPFLGGDWFVCVCVHNHVLAVHTRRIHNTVRLVYTSLFPPSSIVTIEIAYVCVSNNNQRYRPGAHHHISLPQTETITYDRGRSLLSSFFVNVVDTSCKYYKETKSHHKG